MPLETEEKREMKQHFDGSCLAKTSRWRFRERKKKKSGPHAATGGGGREGRGIYKHAHPYTHLI